MSNYFGGNFWVNNYWTSNFFHGGATPTPTPTPPVVLTQLEDIISRRSKYSLPINVPLSDIGMFGGRSVPIMAFEPNAATFHDKFYYNSRHNILYKRLNTKPFPVWKAVGN